MTLEVRRTKDHVHLRVPVDAIHALRVSLQPCPCRAPKSNSAADVRAEMYQALKRGLLMQPHTQKEK